MTTANETTTEEKPKRARRGAKAEDAAPLAAAVEPALDLPPDPATDDSGQIAPELAVATSFAADLQAAQATGEPEWEWETSEEVIEVPITSDDCRMMLRANGADEDAKAKVDREIDALKATLKEKKSESEGIAARIKDRNRMGSKDTQSRKAHWKVGTCFALNTVQYVDPDTGVEVLRRSLTAAERQLELGGVAGPADATETTDPEALLRAQELGERDPADAPLDNEPSYSDLGDDDDDLSDGEEEESDS